MRQPPLLLEDFSNARRWSAYSERAYTSVAVLPMPEQPRVIPGKNARGANALRIDYDFRLETTEGGSRRSYCRTDPGVLVVPEGAYPTHLGLWLYGDGSTAWANGCVADANGREEEIAYGDLDWTGWRFVTGAIPPGLSLPLSVSYPLRLLSGDNTMRGTVWVGAVMALYGGIDFDAVPPVIEDIAFADGRVTAHVYDPDDHKNNCPASGVDHARTEFYIDNVRHMQPIILRDGWHKLEIIAYDKAGNAARKYAFFRQGEGIDWEIPARVYLGNAFNVSITGLNEGYDALHIEWEFGGERGETNGALTLTAGFDLPGPVIAALRCLNAYYTKDHEKNSFCLPDLQTELIAGLDLVMRRFCADPKPGGFEPEFIVTDKEGNLVPDARIVCSGEFELGQTIKAYAKAGDDYSYTKKVIVSRDFARPLPANIMLTLRGPSEVGITWQCGIEADAGFVQADGQEITAGFSPKYTVLYGQYTELAAFRAVLSGLEPGQTYHYRVGKPGAWSPEYEFKMPDGPAVTFAVLTDTHNFCGRAMESALKRCPGLDFFLHVGDYVGSGGAYGDWLALHEDSRGLLSSNLLLPVIGNHDTMDGDGAHFHMIFGEAAYAREIGCALFVALGEELDAQAEAWLYDIIENTTQTWKILLKHSGPYTCYLSSEAYEQKMSALVEKLGFDLVLSGHDHVYHRATIRGVTYIQCGSSGHGRDVPSQKEDHRPIWDKIHDSTQPVYSLIEVTEEKINLWGAELSQERPEGIVFDRFHIDRSDALRYNSLSDK